MNLYFHDIGWAASFCLGGVKLAQMANANLPIGERTAQAEPQGATSSIKGKTERTNLTSKLAIYSTSIILALSFSLFNPVISDSFSLDTGKCSFPSRTSPTNLSIKRENASSLKRR